MHLDQIQSLWIAKAAMTQACIMAKTGMAWCCKDWAKHALTSGCPLLAYLAGCPGEGACSNGKSLGLSAYCGCIRTDTKRQRHVACVGGLGIHQRPSHHHEHHVALGRLLMHDKTALCWCASLSSRCLIGLMQVTP